MDVLIYKLGDLADVVISTRGNIAKLQRDYFSRFGEGMTVDYRVSDPGTLVVGGEPYAVLNQPRPEKPVIFETPNYFVDVEFKDSADVKPGSMYVRHHLEEISGRFIARGLSLSGQLSFVNEPGKFRFEVAYDTKSSGERSFWLEFMVASTKMNVLEDYREIVKKVEAEDRNLIFSSYAKTVNDVAIKQRAAEAGDWSWAVYFEKAFDEYEDALKRILHEPHKRIVAHEDYRRAEQIRRWSPAMAREFARFKCDQSKLQVHRFKDVTAENTFDTYENQYVKYTLGKMSEWLREASKVIGDDERYSAEFRNGIAERARRFAQYTRTPVLRCVGRFLPKSGGSLVLQMRPGYAQIRIVWELMHSLFTSENNMASQKFSVGFNSLAALYEFWCFLQMREILDGQLGSAAGYVREDVLPSGLSIGRILEGALSREDDVNVKAMGYKYVKDGNVVAELMFQQSYGPDMESPIGYARPFYQRPDIVLRVFQKEKSYTYLFDAKYQLESDSQGDAAPRTALDQMHRYRDAILYRQGRVTRDVVGAYILYPGDDNRQLFDYTEIIEEQNIGAFPLLPDKCDRLKSQIISLFARAFADEDYTNWIVEDAIPQRHLQYVPESSAVMTDQSIIIAKGYPSGFVDVVRAEKRCPWILPVGMKPEQAKLILCGSVNGVDKILLANTPPVGPFTKAEMLAGYSAFAAIEPTVGSKGRRFPDGTYWVWNVAES